MKDKIVTSKSFTWTADDTKRTLRNALRFLAPLILMYIGVVSGKLGTDGGSFSWSAFAINPYLLGGMTLYLLNAIQDALTKFLGSEKYVVEK